MGSHTPRIVILHYTAPPVVGGVESVIAEHVRLFKNAGYPVLLAAGRGGEPVDLKSDSVLLVPEMDSENPEYLVQKPALERGEMPPGFRPLRDKLQTALAGMLSPTDIVIAHNVMTERFNFALTAAIHSLADRGEIRNLVVWCHDVSQHIDPARGGDQRRGFPWDLLRKFRPDASYVAVSSARRYLLSEVLGCPADKI